MRKQNMRIIVNIFFKRSMLEYFYCLASVDLSLCVWTKKIMLKSLINSKVNLNRISLKRNVFIYMLRRKAYCVHLLI